VIGKLLVANRGEIARRIFRTCRSMGIATVAVFSDPDRTAPYVGEADEGFHLPGFSAADTYLNIEAIVEAARRTRSDAVHPGYGFLAENPQLARAVVAAGLVWVGPPAEAIEAMGNKLAAKELVRRAGVPTLDSVSLDGLAEQEVEQAADRLGWPVLIKAAAGGGGKGMRIVRSPSELSASVEGARRESAAAFADDSVFLEPYLEAPRHIEVQVVADRKGAGAALFERECSIQRRHQKIIEEAPSPVLDQPTRQAMSEAAVATARAVSYVGLGTVEFLYQEGRFFFLEMNTRLQVEHPVTEEITGIDLVRLQLRLAAGDPLPEEVVEPAMIGHAIEARLYAEDPANDFLPVTGTVHQLAFPEGVRVEAGVEAGSEVSHHYDPMIAKVVAWAETREEAAQLLAAALTRAHIHGLTTNRELLVRVLRHPEFLAGRIDTHFLERHSPSELSRPLPDVEETRLAAVAAALAAQEERRRRAGAQASIPSGWRNSPSQMQEVTFDSAYGEIRAGYRFSTRGGLAVAIDGGPLGTVSTIRLDPDRVGLEVDGHLHWFTISRHDHVHHVDGPGGYTRLVEHPRFPPPVREPDPGSLHAPMPGKVIRLAVGLGDAVEEGQVLAVLEAMKMEHTLRSPHAGTVTSVQAAAGDQVDAGQVLVVIETAGE
jgi:propionyl-CoA carboxylase alpha chain